MQFKDLVARGGFALLVKAAKAGSLLLVDKAFCFSAKCSISNTCVCAISQIFTGFFLVVVFSSK